MTATGVTPTVLIPVKGFRLAKGRLADRLSESQRHELARTMAAQVVKAAGSLVVRVVCDNDEVADWARSAGAEVLWIEAKGLNPAVTAAVAALEAESESEADTDTDGTGPGHVLIAHADLPHAETLGGLAEAGTVTIVPDRHLDGTNVMALPLGTGFEFHYGAGSFAAHCEEALRRGLDLRVRRVRALEFDVDTPDDFDAAGLDLPRPSDASSS